MTRFARVYIALEEAGAPYEAVPVDFGAQAQRSPEYLAINPKGRVPALVTESGTLTETPGLLLFVAQRFSQAELAPLSGPFALAQVQEFNSYLCSTVHVAHAHGRRGARWVDDAAAIGPRIALAGYHKCDLSHTIRRFFIHFEFARCLGQACR